MSARFKAFDSEILDSEILGFYTRLFSLNRKVIWIIKLSYRILGIVPRILGSQNFIP